VNGMIYCSETDKRKCDWCGNEHICAVLQDDAASGDEATAVCSRCLAKLLQQMTGFKFVNQLLAWETVRDFATYTRYQKQQRKKMVEE